MTRNWKPFDRVSNPRGTREPLATIEKKGTLRINEPAYDAIGRPDLVEFLWDEDGEAIGIRGADETILSAYKVRKHAQAATYVISFLSFARFHNIPLEETRRHHATVEDGVLVIDLQRAATSGARFPRRAKIDDTRAQPQLLACAETGG